ncbi:MAG: hypothetical protein AB7R69_06540, partial [Candidatus Babeliales bacterium]
MNKEDKETRYAKWRALVEEQQKSGLSQTDFCKQHGIVLSQFTYYYLQVKPKSKLPVKMNTSNSFVPVSVRAETTSTPMTEVRVFMPNGLQCVLPSLAPAEEVKRLIRMLLSC